MPSGSTRRSDWADAPRALVRAVERSLGARVVGQEAVQGGTSSRVAARLSLDDERQVFVKAVAAQQDPRAFSRYAQEADVLRRLPEDVPHAPLLTSARHDDWFAIVTSAASGSAVGPPWRTQHVAAVTDAITRTSGRTDVRGLAPAVERLPALDGWQQLASRPEVLDDWERGRLQTLVAMSDGWRTWTAGPHLVHLAVRCDNVVEHEDGVWLVDWGRAAAGAAWLDAAGLAVDVVASGHVGGGALALSTARGILAGLPYEATRLMVALAGTLRQSSLREPVAAVPGLRAWQAARAGALRPLLEATVTR
jgi:hypothetical protein